MVLQVYNPYADTVDVSVSNVSVTLATYTLTLVKNGSWDKSAATGYTIFEGDITIDAQTFAALVANRESRRRHQRHYIGKRPVQLDKTQSQRPFYISSLPGVVFH